MLFFRIKQKLKRCFQNLSFDDFKKISYSQCGEDLIVSFIFNRLGILNPNYIDIGAHHPYKLSNTAFFYESGSRGINIEPDQNYLLHLLNIGKKMLILT